jgi:GT2 family glycosyltransferase
MSAFAPIQIFQVDIGLPLLRLDPQMDFELNNYRRALILVHLHTQLLGTMNIEIPEGGMLASELASEIWLSMSMQIEEHLYQDGVIQAKPLDQAGITMLPDPPCLNLQHDLLTTAPFVTVVIATRDRVSSLQACIRSVLALDYPHYDVIVVDNAPKSSETADFMHANFPNSTKVRYLREDVPGLAIAHNRALKNVESTIVAFTDDDVIVNATWLREIVANFQRDPQIGCVTGMILPYEIETPPQLWIEQFGGFGKGYQRILFDMKENHPDDFLFPYSAGRFGSGANMAFRTSILKEIGGFDPALGAGTLAKGGDDLAVFFDVITKGYRLVYEPRAILYHKHRRDYPGLAQQAYGYGVGLSAFLMKTIIDNPARLVQILLKMPLGLKHILDPQSRKNQKKQTDYPHELTQLELKGFLMGPLAYLRSHWRVRRLKKQSPKVSLVSNSRNIST